MAYNLYAHGWYKITVTTVIITFKLENILSNIIFDARIARAQDFNHLHICFM